MTLAQLVAQYLEPQTSQSASSRINVPCRQVREAQQADTCAAEGCCVVIDIRTRRRVFPTNTGS